MYRVSRSDSGNFDNTTKSLDNKSDSKSDFDQLYEQLYDQFGEEPNLVEELEDRASQSDTNPLSVYFEGINVLGEACHPKALGADASSKLPKAEVEEKAQDDNQSEAANEVSRWVKVQDGTDEIWAEEKVPDPVSSSKTKKGKEPESINGTHFDGGSTFSITQTSGSDRNGGGPQNGPELRNKLLLGSSAKELPSSLSSPSVASTGTSKKSKLERVGKAMVGGGVPALAGMEITKAAKGSLVIAVGGLIANVGVWAAGGVGTVIGFLFAYLGIKATEAAHFQRTIVSKIKALTSAKVPTGADRETTELRTALEKKDSVLRRFAKFVAHKQNPLSSIIGATGAYAGGAWGFTIGVFAIGAPAIATAAGLTGTIAGVLGTIAFFATPVGWGFAALGSVCLIAGLCYYGGRRFYQRNQIQKFEHAWRFIEKNGVLDLNLAKQELDRCKASYKVAKKDLKGSKESLQQPDIDGCTAYIDVYKAAKKWADRLASEKKAVSSTALEYLANFGIGREELSAFRDDILENKKAKGISEEKRAEKKRTLKDSLIKEFIAQLVLYKCNTWNPEAALFHDFCKSLWEVGADNKMKGDATRFIKYLGAFTDEEVTRIVQADNEITQYWAKMLISDRLHLEIDVNPISDDQGLNLYERLDLRIRNQHEPCQSALKAIIDGIDANNKEELNKKCQELANAIDWLTRAIRLQDDVFKEESTPERVRAQLLSRWLSALPDPQAAEVKILKFLPQLDLEDTNAVLVEEIRQRLHEINVDPENTAVWPFALGKASERPAKWVLVDVVERPYLFPGATIMECWNHIKEMAATEDASKLIADTFLNDWARLGYAINIITGRNVKRFESGKNKIDEVMHALGDTFGEEASRRLTRYLSQSMFTTLLKSTYSVVANNVRQGTEILASKRDRATEPTLMTNPGDLGEFYLRKVADGIEIQMVQTGVPSMFLDIGNKSDVVSFDKNTERKPVIQIYQTYKLTNKGEFVPVDYGLLKFKQQQRTRRFHRLFFGRGHR